MQYTLIDILNTEHILVGIEAADAQEAIRELTAVLVETEHVTPEFAEDVWNREGSFPTGLPTQPLAVAIPHADPDHVNRSAVCIGIFKSPVQFAQMGTDGSTVLDVTIIFLLAIKEKEKQVEMIQQLIALIQSHELLEKLSKIDTPSEAAELIKSFLV
jgi:PTS system galactitol-specific IIA component